MKILAVDTALGACSVVILSNDKVLAHRFVAMERGHAEALAPMVDEVMGKSGIAFSDLDRLGVTTGPGTFTGQRVGLAFMRGLRVALKRPLVGVTSLAAMARQAMEETALNQAAAIHDARRDEVYFEHIGPLGAQIGPRLLVFGAATMELAKAAGGAPVAVCGTAASRVLAHAQSANLVMSKVTAPDALWVARLCARVAATDEPPKPLYLREPDARLPGERK
jgi:tRNA threonylcarbamoyladenosine biosynthesis protein TsaB